MAVFKVSSSGKQGQFIADDGTMYVLPSSVIQSILDKKTKLGLCMKYPVKVSPDRFKQSEVYDPQGLAETTHDSLRVSNDGLSKSFKKTQENTKKYKDDFTW